MVDFNTFYRQYGESLAARLKAIGHTFDSARFVFVEDQATAEEVLAAQTRELKSETNVLVWERPAERLTDGRRDNYHATALGSFAVIRKPAKDGRAERSGAVNICRDVALKVMALMRQDAYEGYLATQNIRFQVDGLEGEPIPTLRNGWVGYGFAFDWLVPLDLTLSDDDLTDDGWLFAP